MPLVQPRLAATILDSASSRFLARQGLPFEELHRHDESALNRLLDDGLIQELDERPDPDLDDERRRYYRLTDLGRAVARAEAASGKSLKPSPKPSKGRAGHDPARYWPQRHR